MPYLASPRRRRARVRSSAFTTISDAFTRADSAVSLGSATTGQAWVQMAGTWGISTNTAYQPGAVNNAVAYVEANRSDCAVSATLTLGASGNTVGVAFRIQDASNFLWAGFTPTTIFILKCVAGVHSVVTSVAQATATGDVITVDMRATSITVKQNGVARISGQVVTECATATKHGLTMGAAAADQRWDDFSITA